MPRVLELLEQHAPDLLLMQETKSDPAPSRVMELEAAGYQAVHHTAGRWAGVALAAPVERTSRTWRRAGGRAGPRRGALARGHRGRHARRAPSTCRTAARSDSPTYADKLALPRRGAPAASPSWRAESLVVAGDFNVCPTDLDVYDPAAFVGETHVTPAERERFAAVLDAGVVDAYRALHPDEPGFTWWDYRQGHFHRKLGLRIDPAARRLQWRSRLESVRHRPQLPQGPEALGPRAAARSRSARLGPRGRAAQNISGIAARRRACARRRARHAPGTASAGERVVVLAQQLQPAAPRRPRRTRCPPGGAATPRSGCARWPRRGPRRCRVVELEAGGEVVVLHPSSSSAKTQENGWNSLR